MVDGLIRMVGKIDLRATRFKSNCTKHGAIPAPAKVSRRFPSLTASHIYVQTVGRPDAFVTDFQTVVSRAAFTVRSGIDLRRPNSMSK